MTSVGRKGIMSHKLAAMDASHRFQVVRENIIKNKLIKA